MIGGVIAVGISVYISCFLAVMCRISDKLRIYQSGALYGGQCGAQPRGVDAACATLAIVRGNGVAIRWVFQFDGSVGCCPGVVDVPV